METFRFFSASTFFFCVVFAVDNLFRIYNL
jgi:hypothetical protein